MNAALKQILFILKSEMAEQRTATKSQSSDLWWWSWWSKWCIWITECNIGIDSPTKRVKWCVRKSGDNQSTQSIKWVLCILEHMQAKWTFPYDSMYMNFLSIFCVNLLLRPLSYTWIGIYCVIKISDKKIFIFCIFIFIAMLKRFSILYIWTECAHMCVCVCICISADMSKIVHANARLVYENLCTDMFSFSLSFSNWMREKWVEIRTHTLACSFSQANLSGIKWA